MVKKNNSKSNNNNKNKNSATQPKSANKPKSHAPNKQRGGGSLFQNLGSAIGGVFGGPAGAALGRSAGGFVSKITGMGAYSVSKNTVLDNSAPPSFGSGGTGTEIAHREFLSDVSGSTDFALTAYSINPGLPSSFPWLAQLASNYEEYEMLGLVYEFRPTSGSAVSSTSSALGTVVMATNYDSQDPVFTNKQQMEAYEFSSSSVPFNLSIHPVECAKDSSVLTRQYVRTTDIPAGQDSRFYDLGNFQIACAGMQSVYTVGELWVSYHVRLYKPRLDVPLGANILSGHIVESTNGSATAAKPMGVSGGVVRSGSTLDTASLAPTSTTFVLPYGGLWLLSMGFSDASIAAAPNVTLGSNLSFATLFADDSGASIASFTASYASFMGVVKVVAPGTGAANTVTIGGLTGMSAGTTDIFVTQVSSGISSNRKAQRLESSMVKLIEQLMNQRDARTKLVDYIEIKSNK